MEMSEQKAKWNCCRPIGSESTGGYPGGSHYDRYADQCAFTIW